ncbi:MAG: hypothetical protein FJ280_10580 [Planctomycetes bacterium]|nr:hypothetical protein [Planctomycetota bacterium]
MPFHFHTNLLARASRALASGILVVGLLLIGFGLLIMALPELFAFLAAAVFFVAGVGCAVVALKILWFQRRLERSRPGEVDVYRQNVRIHTGGPHDL